MQKTLLFLIGIYRNKLRSIFSLGECRYYPSCSCYAEVAISKNGALIGLAQTFLRILKCNGYVPGGYNPVSIKLFHVEH